MAGAAESSTGVVVPVRVLQDDAHLPAGHAEVDRKLPGLIDELLHRDGSAQRVARLLRDAFARARFGDPLPEQAGQVAHDGDGDHRERTAPEEQKHLVRVGVKGLVTVVKVPTHEGHK